VFEVNIKEVVWNEYQILGSRASSRRETVELLKLVKSGKFKYKPLITHTVSLDEINFGLNLMRKNESIRVVVKP
jgi:threonine dehydrogenase-like Zn-dependent dehydrogenase